MPRSLLMMVALAAASTLAGVPAQAQSMTWHRGTHTLHHDRRSGFVANCRGDLRGNRYSDCAADGDGWAYADGNWALANNRSWGPDSFNDWWNDRPDRAYPRWVQEQRMRGTCSPDRMWWSGSGWHC